MTPTSRFSLFKRRNNIWYILYEVDGKRKWKSTGVKVKSDALKAIRDFENLTKQKRVVKSLRQFIDDFLPFAKKTFAHRTYLIYSGALGGFHSFVQDIALNSITPQHIDRFKVKRLEDGLNPTTLNIELRTLRAAFNTAIRWKLLEDNPSAQVQSVRIPEATPAYLSRADFQSLLKAISEEWLKEILIFATLTGMRRGEILNLRWGDIDLQKRLIFIQSNPTFKTKQGKRRVIPMNDAIYSLMQRKSQNIQNDEYIFTKKGRKINDDHASKMLKKYVRAVLGKNCRLHFHSLRHTFASWLVQDGVSLYEVQKLLGHSNIAVTQVYSHLQPEALHNTVNRISMPMN